MTIRDCYEACLVELNKVQAPSLLLKDFVYLLNKNIQEYFNKQYISFEKNQQNSDNLRSLINQVTLSNLSVNPNVVYGTSWDCPLPSDYVHILGGKAVFGKLITDKCAKTYTEVVGLNKLTSTQAPQISSNWYMRPSHKRPYYQIVNIEQTNPTYIQTTPDSLKSVGTRYGNSTQPIMQIICGNDPKYILKAVEIQYLQAPRYVSLTQDQLDLINDTSDVLEFPDYVCNEIIKQLVTQILENNSNQRIQTFAAVNASIPQN